MNNSNQKLSADEKTNPVMIYMVQALVWGHLVSKKAIKVSTWLQSEMAPNYLDCLDAQVLLFGTGQSTTNIKFPLLHLQKEQINAYHIMPPGDESPYFDENEPHRKMESVTIISGIFRFDAKLRMAEQSDLKTYLGVHKSQYIPIFEATITSPLLPSMKKIQAPFALVNNETALFSKYA